MQKNKLFKTGVAIIAAVGLVAVSAIVALAAPAKWNPPTAPMVIDKNIITISSHGAAEVMPEFLGANLVTARPLLTLPADISGDDRNIMVTEKAFLGIYGSSVNSNPDPYVWNYFYNQYAIMNNLPQTDVTEAVLDLLQGSPAGADVTILPQFGTSGSLAMRPDIIIGTDAQPAGGGYADLLKELPENKDSDPNNNYNPVLLPYGMANIAAMIDTMHATAKEMNNITAATGKVGRYGDPEVIAVDYENVVRGIQFYVLSELEKNNIAKKVVAVIGAADQGDGTFLAYNTSLSSGTAASTRGAEYTELTTINIVDKLGLKEENGICKITAQQLLEADVIFIAGANSVVMTKDAFITLLVDKYKVDAQKIRQIPIHDANPAVVFGITVNSVENALGFGIYQGFIYANDIDFNPIYASAYFYERFYHLTDANALSNAIAANFQDASLPDGTTTSLSRYSAGDMEAKLIAGMKYYQEHESEYKGTKLEWNINTTMGLGTALNAADPDKFTDIASHWAKDSIVALVARGMFNGVSDTKFDPQGTMSKAMVVTVLHRYDGKPLSGSNKFTDVSINLWYTAAATWAGNNNIAVGVSGTLFNPNAEITREQLALTLYNYAKYKNIAVTATNDLSTFTDSASVSAECLDALKWAATTGIVQGRTTTTIDPKGTATRAEVVTMLVRFLDIIEK